MLCKETDDISSENQIEHTMQCGQNAQLQNNEEGGMHITLSYILGLELLLIVAISKSTWYKFSVNWKWLYTQMPLSSVGTDNF